MASIRPASRLRPTVFFAACLALLLASRAEAAIAITNTSAATPGLTSNLSWTHTVSTGTDRLLLVGMENKNPGGAALRTVTAVTWTVGATTQTLTLVGAAQNGTDNRATLWAVVAPTQGTGTISATAAGNTGLEGGAISFTGVHQTQPTVGFTSATGTSTTASVTVNSLTNWVVVDSVVTNGAANSLTVGAGQTQRWSGASGANQNQVRGAGSTEPGASSVTMS
jgi:hypothetical protein